MFDVIYCYFSEIAGEILKVFYNLPFKTTTGREINKMPVILNKTAK
jgi:hypothetical protein